MLPAPTRLAHPPSVVIVLAFLIALPTFACGGDDAPSTAPPPEVGALDGGVPDADTGGDASLDASSDTDGGSAGLRILRDRTLPGHVQPFDVFAPANARRVVIFLHGGLGKKEISPNQIGVTVNDVPDQAWLEAQQTAFVFPQGSAIAAAPSATTWSNYVMTSGQDDVSFLRALQAALRAGGIDPTLSAFERVYVAGHSNGGMMANRLWCEASASFDGFAAFAGPASVTLHPLTGGAPCKPSDPKPYLGIIGGKDDTIQTTGNWGNDVWTVTDKLSSGPSFVNPNLVNEEVFHRVARVPALCGGAASAPVTAAGGATTTWSDCDGKAVLVRVTNADHCLKPTTTCRNALESESGTVLRDRLMTFFVGTEP